MGRDSRGVSSVEFGLVLLLIAVAAFLGVAFLGDSLGDQLDEVPGAFDGESVTTTTVDDGGGTGDGGGGGPIEDPCDEVSTLPECVCEPGEDDCP